MFQKYLIKFPYQLKFNYYGNNFFTCIENISPYVEIIDYMQHIYYCEILNNGRKTNIEYEKLYTGNISEQIEIWRQFERNMEEREKLLKEESSPRDPSVIHCIRQI